MGSPPLFTLILALSALSLRAGDTLLIALTGAFSGGSATQGTSMRDGARLAIQEINAAGGIPVGRHHLRIRVLERDDEGKNERGALIAQELASMAALSGVIGTVNTGVALAGDKYFEHKGITKLVTPCAGSQCMAQWSRAGVRNLSIFRFGVNDGIQSAMAVAELTRRGLTRVALLHDSTNYGVSGRDDLLREIRAQGKVQVVALEKFNMGDRDMTAQLLKARTGGAQAVLVWGQGLEAAIIANGMAKLGLKVPLIGSSALASSNFTETAGRNGNGTLMPETFIEEPINPPVAAFLARFHKAYRVTRIAAPMAAAQGYDCVKIFAAAVQQAQSADTRRIKEALEDLREPVAGVIAIWRHPFSRWNPADPQTQEAFRQDQAVMGMVLDGRIVFSDPADRDRLSRATTP